MATFQLPDLPYDYNALEPHIDERTMRIHHTKHHQGYANGLNGAIEKAPSLASKSVEEILGSIESVPQEVRGAVNFHGGGYINHRIFWNNMSPDGGGQPDGELGRAIDTAFGDFDGFKNQFKTAATGIQGSGWSWLVWNPTSKRIEITTMPNQTSVLTEGLVPLLGLDMWEHAFYLNYQNEKGKYVDAWWNVVNWADVAKRFQDAR